MEEERNYWERIYDYWHPSALINENGCYRIAVDGVLTKKDCTILFSTGDKGMYLPAENTEQLNFFDDVSLDSGIIQLLAEKGIVCNFYNKYGMMVGRFIPEGSGSLVDVLVKQAYNCKDEGVRTRQGAEIEKAIMYHLQKMVKYYSRNSELEFSDEVAEIEMCSERMDRAGTVNGLLIIEARARQIYYDVLGRCFEGTKFTFGGRSKRPPLDEVNAMISFGNTILYGDMLKKIKEEGLDERFGVIHSINRHITSLNLDLADIYKPLIVDRTIISLVKRHRIRKEHFEPANGGIYMSREGKKIFTEAYNETMNRGIKIHDVKTTLRTYLTKQVKEYKRCLLNDEIWSPGKVY